MTTVPNPPRPEDTAAFGALRPGTTNSQRKSSSRHDLFSTPTRKRSFGAYAIDADYEHDTSRAKETRNPSGGFLKRMFKKHFVHPISRMLTASQSFCEWRRTNKIMPGAWVDDEAVEEDVSSPQKTAELRSDEVRRTPERRVSGPSAQEIEIVDGELMDTPVRVHLPWRRTQRRPQSIWEMFDVPDPFSVEQQPEEGAGVDEYEHRMTGWLRTLDEYGQLDRATAGHHKFLKGRERKLAQKAARQDEERRHQLAEEERQRRRAGALSEARAKAWSVMPSAKASNLKKHDDEQEMKKLGLESYEQKLAYYNGIIDLAEKLKNAQLAEEEERKSAAKAAEEAAAAAQLAPIVPSIRGKDLEDVNRFHAGNSFTAAQRTPRVNEQNGLTVHDVLSTAPGQWLNDEVVNNFLKVVSDRIHRDTGYKKDKNVPAVTVFSTHWVTSYQKKKWDGVARWWKRQGVEGAKMLQCKTILFPVNSGTHWTLIHIDGVHKKITYYDSLGAGGSMYTTYALDMVKGNLGSAYKPDEWTVEVGKSNRQTNSDDCGVWMSMNALAIMMGRTPVDAIQGEDMLHARQLICIVGIRNALDSSFDPFLFVEESKPKLNGHKL